MQELVMVKELEVHQSCQMLRCAELTSAVIME